MLLIMSIKSYGVETSIKKSKWIVERVGKEVCESMETISKSKVHYNFAF